MFVRVARSTIRRQGFVANGELIFVVHAWGSYGSVAFGTFYLSVLSFENKVGLFRIVMSEARWRKRYGRMTTLAVCLWGATGRWYSRQLSHVLIDMARSTFNIEWLVANE